MKCPYCKSSSLIEVFNPISVIWRNHDEAGNIFEEGLFFGGIEEVLQEVNLNKLKELIADPSSAKKCKCKNCLKKWGGEYDKNLKKWNKLQEIF